MWVRTQMRDGCGDAVGVREEMVVNVRDEGG
jgi:hypothetical protein